VPDRLIQDKDGGGHGVVRRLGSAFAALFREQLISNNGLPNEEGIGAPSDGGTAVVKLYHSRTYEHLQEVSTDT